MKIRHKTYFTFLILGFVLTMAGVVVYFMFFSSNYEKVVSENLETLAHIKEKNINILLENRLTEKDNLVDVAEINQSVDNISQENFVETYKQAVDASHDIEEILLVDKTGRILFGTNSENKGRYFDKESDSILYTLDRPILGTIRVESNNYYQYASYPVTGQDYYLLLKYNLDSVLDILADREGMKYTGEALIATQEGGDIVFISDRKFPVEYSGDMEPAYPMRLALEKKRGNLVDSLDYRNEPVMASYLYLDRLGVGLVVKMDRTEALGFIEQMIYVSSILAIALMLLVYVATNILSRRLAKPIEELNEAVEVVAGGNWDYQINISGDDEIAKTAQSFHKMAQTIKNSRDKSEKQISEQTKNLREQQMAILNILEDVEAEKEKVADTAKELEKFRQAVENTSDHVVITDADGTVIYANPAVTVITGFTRDEVIGTKVGTKENWGGLMGQAFYKNLWETIKRDKKSFSGYINNVRKNGEKYEALANISPVFDAGGNVIFFVGIERDFTREREIDRAKSEFVSLASHQLRTPLSTVNWYAEILLSRDAGKINKEQEEYLQEIYKGNQRMVNLVNALLNVSRIDLGTLSIDPEPTSLIDLANSVLKELELKIKERGHKIVKLFDKDIPEINLDPKMMRIVWQNYLTNAVKYTPKDGTVEVSIKKKKSYVEIAVKDDGMGIPEPQQEKIFKKLFRADNAREKETDGTGLGLYIVKSIIEEFGGKVWFESKENQGSTFFATIPLKGVKAKAGSKGLEYVD